MGVGAYTTALLIKGGTVDVLRLIGHRRVGTVPFLHGVRCSRASPASCSASLIGFPALRVQKHYLAFVTLAFTVFLWLVFRNEEWLTGGVFGIQDIKRPERLRRRRCRRRGDHFAQLFVVRADHDAAAGGADVVAGQIAVGPRLHGAAREPDPRGKPRHQCAPLHAARVRHRLGLWRLCRLALCAAGRVHRSGAVLAGAVAAVPADDRRRRHGLVLRAVHRRGRRGRAAAVDRDLPVEACRHGLHVRVAISPTSSSTACSSSS